MIWVLITFSKEYSTTITYPVVYKNIPLNKLLQEEPIKEIDVTIKATGFKILRTKARREPIQIQASKLNRNGKSSFYILPKNQFSKIEAQLL